MMRRLARLHKDSQGFTLVELMIVVAIIGILAAIAVPQFAAYRTRAFNANAKAMNKQAVNSQSDLNAELGVFGHTMAAAGTLVAADGAVAAGVSSTTPALAVAATATIAGGRIVGLNVSTGKTFSVPLGFGNNMALITWGTVATAAGGVCDSGGCSNIVVARADKGDTAYGSDSDAANTLYSVSNPNWASGAAGIAATLPVLANDGCNDFTTVACVAAAVAGNGSPTQTWAQVQ